MERNHSSLKLIHQFFLSTTVSTLFLAGLGLFCLVNSQRLMGLLDHVTQVGVPAIRNMTLLDMSHDAVRAAVYGALVAAETSDTEGLKEARHDMDEEAQNFQRYLNVLRQLALRSETQNALKSVEVPIAGYLAAGMDVLKKCENGELKAAHAALPSFMASFRNLESTLESLGTQIESDAAAENVAGREILQVTGIITVAAIAISLGLSFIILVRLLTTFRSTLQSILNAVHSLKYLGDKLSASSQQLFQSVRTTSGSLEETTSTLRHFKEQMDTAEHITSEVKNVGESCHTIAFEATGHINRMIEAIERTSKESQKMQEMTRAIEDIAFQTHLLAVNASIEAARAGHQGKGFAVVADAVQNLAAKSSQSAKVIGEQIHEAISDMEQGNRIADEGRKSMQRIHSATEQQVTLNGQQFAINHEQSAGLAEISRTMTILDQESQQNARVAESLTESAAQLSQSTEELCALIDSLRLELGSKAS